MKSLTVTHKKFGERLKELREKKGKKENRNFTQEDLAELVEVDRSYIGFLERGEKNPTLKKLEKIAKVFDMSLSELFKSI
jgi:transcriptional regulator with XRE-family HTH domain